MQEAVWQSVLGEIELSVSRASFATWFKNTHLLQNQDGLITVGVPNIFAKQQLEVKFNDQIIETLRKNGIEVKKVEYTIHSGPPKSVDVIKPPIKPVRSGKMPVARQSLNDRYRFDTFVVGSSNELAYTACQAIFEHPGTKYNPLFVYGGVGLGKTHLVQAVGNGITRKHPDKRVVYVTCETFVNDFVESIRFKKKDFADRYRSADVLIVDDIQFIAGKEKTQEEFFHTFNTLHQANKQIIISSDKPPKSIPTLEERLRSRFEWGMIVDIQPPDFETRCAILQTKANQNGVNLSPDVIEYLATHAQTNIRELEGALNHLLAFCEMRGYQPDLDIAKGLVGSSHNRPKRVTPKQIVERTAKHFHVSLEDITGPKRDKEIVSPRQVAMYLLRNELHLSFPRVARELGRKDHTTAIHSVDKIERSIRLDQAMRQHVNDIRERLYA